MRISINPVALLDFLLKSKFNSKQKVVEYIESIADEADSLARVWEEVVNELQKKDCAEIGNKQSMELEKYKEPNAPYYTRLMEFYHNLSIAVGGKIEERWHDSMALHLGNLLYHRELTLKNYVNSIERMSNPIIFVDEDNQTVNLKDLIESVAVLHREAGKIHALARMVRAL